MSRQGEAKIKFTADMKDVESKIKGVQAQIQRLKMHGIPMNSGLGQSLKRDLAKQRYAKLNVQNNYSQGLYEQSWGERNLSKQGLKDFSFGGSSVARMGMIAGGGLALAKITADMEERITARRNAFSTATLTNINQANAGLMTGADFEKRQMDATRKNLMGLWGNIPFVSGWMQRKMDQDKGYQNYMIDLERQQNIQSDASSATMSAWNNARAMGFKMSDNEIQRLAQINLNIANQRQDAQQKINTIMQQTKESQGLEKKRKEYEDKFLDLNPLKEVMNEFFGNLKTLIMTDFIGSMRTALGL